jgi:phospholipid/cholesterol/gamma-HCH transport system substrate-binding protein
VLLLASAVFVVTRPSSMTITAYFSEAKGMYVGDNVTILGVRVGKVTSITPDRANVKVEMKIDTKWPISQDVKAAIVAPSLVSVRAIALGPAYTGGARLGDGGTIPISRTAIPVEWDAVKDQLVRLSQALGPTKPGQKGALGDLVSASAGLLKGQGTTLRTTVENLSEALSTLSDNRGNLFATVRNLQVFVAALSSSNAEVRDFNTRLADVSTLLAGDGTEIRGALTGLSRAFVDVQKFLRANKDITVSTLKELRNTTSLLAENRQYIADVLQSAPTAVSNFYNIMDPRVPGPTGSLVFANLAAPAEIICGTLLNFGGTAADCTQAIGPIAKYLQLQAPPVGLLLGENSGLTSGQLQPLPSPSSKTGTGAGTASKDDGGFLGQLSTLLGGSK